MKPFEERYTAWIDGKLAGAELQAFEKELEQHPDAEADREATLELGRLLRQHASAPPLTNEDFFNHELLTRIAAEESKTSRSEPARRPISVWVFRPYPWLAACCLALAFLGYRGMNHAPQPGLENYVGIGSPAPEETPYNAKIVSAESTDPDISVTPIHSDKDNVTVLWVDGLNYLPASYHVE